MQILISANADMSPFKGLFYSGFILGLLEWESADITALHLSGKADISPSKGLFYSSFILGLLEWESADITAAYITSLVYAFISTGSRLPITKIR